jgi:flavin reductase (DIM6/NTAB) family NADH-FMN oxidoreductase RutF
MQRIHPEEFGPRGAYHFLNAVIGPRPIAWVSTVSPEGTPNLAPHSYTTVAAPEPPIVAFVSVGRKDTLRNVEAMPEFVYNVGGADLIEQINITAADCPPDESEFDWAGVTPVPSELVRPPRVAEAPVQMEARLVDIVQVGATDNYIVLGEVVLIHLDEHLLRDGRVDPERLRPVGRLAGSQYAHMGEVFSLKRPTYDDLLEVGRKPLVRVEG